MTVDEILDDRVRKILKDPSGESWTDLELLAWYNDAARIIMGKKSVSRLDANGDEITYAEATATSDTVQLDDVWVMALTHYVCSLAFLQEGGDRQHLDRSDTHWNRFIDMLNL